MSFYSSLIWFARAGALLLLLVLPSSLCSQENQSESPKISVDVKLDSSPAGFAWQINWRAEGLEPSCSSYELRLKNWGEWDRADSLFLRNLQANVGLVKSEELPHCYRILGPKDWDGSLELSYRVNMIDWNSKARENFGLMPWYKSDYGVGFTSNTIMDLYKRGEHVVAQRDLRFQANSDQWIASGHGKTSKATHSFSLDHPFGNTVIVWGKPTGRIGNAQSSGIEVIQFGGGQKLVPTMKPKLDRVFKRLSTEFGFEPVPPKIIFTDTLGGGVNVDGALLVGYDPRQPDEKAILMTAAHELFHEWLGGSNFLSVKQPESVWFLEGFTDYFSLWFLAHLELIEPQQFVDRLQELNESLAENSAKGNISFGDPNVRWRDGDGPNEMMAYRGGALLAFCADVEFKSKRGGRLTKIISDLAARKLPADNQAIVDWFNENGLDEFQKKYIQQSQFVDVSAALISIGCEQFKVPVPVAYAGFKNDNDGPFGKIISMDPEGAAAKAGIREGDAIMGFWPSSELNLEIEKDKMPKHDYGLNWFAPHDEIHFGVMRGAEELKFKFTPEVSLEIATKPGFIVKGDRLMGFLESKGRR